MENLEDRLINILLRDYQVAEKSTVDDIKKLVHEYTQRVIGEDEPDFHGLIGLGKMRNELRDQQRQKNDQLKHNL